MYFQKNEKRKDNKIRDEMDTLKLLKVSDRFNKSVLVKLHSSNFFENKHTIYFCRMLINKQSTST